MSVKLKFIAVIVLSLIVFNAFSQEKDEDLGEQTLIIYNEYTPVLKDANRIQFLPVIIDTIKVKPEFDYVVYPTIYKTAFHPTPITAASIKGEPLKRLDNGMIKLGMGNYLSPFVEVYYNSKRERHSSVGAFAKHQSAHGTIKNVADHKIYGGYNNSMVKVSGKKFISRATLSGDIDFSSNQVYFYGYNPYIDVLSSIVKPRDRSEMDMQRYNRLKADFGVVSNNTAKTRMDYQLNLMYQYFFTFSDDAQHKIDFNAGLSKLVRSNRYGMDAGVEFNNNVFNSVGFAGITSIYNEVFLNLDPYFKHYTEDWQIKLGVKTITEVIDGVNDFHVYPDIQFQHNISNTIIPYAGFKGYLENNNFENMSIVNPFVNRNNNYQVTNYAQVIDVGLKGNISKNLYFHVNGNYSKIDNMGFFVNDFSMDLDNKFIMEYTNVERFSGYGEFALRNMEKFSFNLKGHYYYYSYIKNSEKPWQLPTFDVVLGTEYKFNDKLKFGFDVGVLSTRFAKEYNSIGDVVEKKLSPIIDLNLSAEYEFASNFNAFVYLNNLTGQKQYYWNNYQSQGFNFMLGLKYLF
jgi:hypothetical protein